MVACLRLMPWMASTTTWHWCESVPIRSLSLCGFTLPSCVRILLDVAARRTTTVWTGFSGFSRRRSPTLVGLQPQVQWCATRARTDIASFSDCLDGARSTIRPSSDCVTDNRLVLDNSCFWFASSSKASRRSSAIVSFCSCSSSRWSSLSLGSMGRPVAASTARRMRCRSEATSPVLSSPATGAGRTAIDMASGAAPNPPTSPTAAGGGAKPKPEAARSPAFARRFFRRAAEPSELPESSS
mmetsp:Transcript_55808/g.130286  ORF Transcript_55808/g.130286 Transcript_55808/m.130286 type:complete len:241 (+) Transcript_55808:308-1030(+)